MEFLKSTKIKFGNRLADSCAVDYPKQSLRSDITFKWQRRGK